MSFPGMLFLSSLRSALRRAADRVRRARSRSHQRLELRGMSDHELKDLGLGRSEVQEWLRRSMPTHRPGIEAPAEAPDAVEQATRPMRSNSFKVAGLREMAYARA